MHNSTSKNRSRAINNGIVQSLLIFDSTLGLVFIYLLCLFNLVSFPNITVIGLLLFSTILAIQGTFNLILMIYAWEDPDKTSSLKSPESFMEPVYSFSILIPARHEEEVIGQTINSISNLNYPTNLLEIFVICSKDDLKTISEAKRAIASSKYDNASLLIFEGEKINKPHALNVALEYAQNEIVGIFDAEDEPHADILQVINTVFLTKKSGVVQSGVQIMNYASHWFGPLNVLEYFFWFKSSLPFFSQFKVVPLGGNSVFFKRYLLNQIGGWDESCLTEDADIGLRLSVIGTKIDIVYDEKHSTHEETPPSLKGFIKQRTRWNQGFFQILQKGDWKKLPHKSQFLFPLYVLLSPQLQAVLILFLPLSFFYLFELKLPAILVLFTNLPLYILGLQIITLCIGFYEFSRDYKIKFSPLTIWTITWSYFFYQLILGVSSFRAIFRSVFGSYNWEKTYHPNVHRVLPQDSQEAIFR